MILFFHIADGNVKAVMTDGRNTFHAELDEKPIALILPCSSGSIVSTLISRKAVQDIDLWFNGRLAVNLIVPDLWSVGIG